MIPTGIKIGDRTHHHDQSIFPHNLRKINIKVRRPMKPTPAGACEDDELI
jgi:hypothetical protein